MGTESGLKKNWNNVDPCSSGNLWLSAPENVLITSINNTVDILWYNFPQKELGEP